jgi:regulator of protease activity HflC (stomatin/prohibitin superfamily)
MSPAMQFALGLVLAVAILPTLSVAFRAFTVEVEDEELVLVTRFGKLAERLERPGLHVLLGQIFPWVKLHRVSLRKDFRDFNDVHVNDARGTTVMVDLWLEFRISDPVKALFRWPTGTARCKTSWPTRPRPSWATGSSSRFCATAPSSGPCSGTTSARRPPAGASPSSRCTCAT